MCDLQTDGCPTISMGEVYGHVGVLGFSVGIKMGFSRSASRICSLVGLLIPISLSLGEYTVC